MDLFLTAFNVSFQKNKNFVITWSLRLYFQIYVTFSTFFISNTACPDY